MNPTLFTIGYGSWKDTNHRMDGMFHALVSAGVTTLVDIRHSPCALNPGSTGSYMAKPWNLQATGGIVEACRQVDIEYQWLVELGNPQKRDLMMKVLKSQIKSNNDIWPVHRGLTLLADLVRDESRSCCILCACEKHHQCHRSIIAESLRGRHFDGELIVVPLGKDPGS